MVLPKTILPIIQNNHHLLTTFDFSEATQRINAEINSLVFDRKPAELYDPVKYFLGLGGKRMRPLLSLLGCYLFNESYEKAVKPSLAIELFHNFTLIHDDIMDNAPLRRGMSTVHEKWNANIALLSGDVTLIEAYELLEHVQPGIRQEIFKMFNLTAKQVCEGQQIDMNFEKQENVSQEEYIEMITLKTAVLLGFSMYMGARIGGATIEDALNIYEAALNMGISFQIKDDYLDVFGEQAKVGKLVGGDIIANKKTYLLLTAFKEANSMQRNMLDQLLVNTHQSKDDKVTGVIKLYNQLDISRLTQEAIHNYFNRALEKISTIDVDLSKREFLKQYFSALMKRES